MIDGRNNPSINYKKDFRRFAYTDFRLEDVHSIPGEIEKEDSGSKQVRNWASFSFFETTHTMKCKVEKEHSGSKHIKIMVFLNFRRQTQSLD
jgi:hypothetical protein